MVLNISLTQIASGSCYESGVRSNSFMNRYRWVEHPNGTLGVQMKRDPFLVLAILAFSFFLFVEVGTVDLGHEFTWFGRLSQLQSATVRYALLAIFISSA